MKANLNWTPDEIYDFVRAYTFPPFERLYIKLGNRKFTF